MRKVSLKALALATALGAGLTLSACGDEESDTPDTTTSTTTTSSETQTAPTAADLQTVLARAVDPNVPTDQKLDTVMGGQEAPELFDALTKASVDSGATFEVKEPVLPSALPGLYTASVNLIMPDREPQLISGVEFVQQDGKYKLDRKWACDLVTNVVPDQVPPMCNQAL